MDFTKKKSSDIYGRGVMRNEFMEKVHTNSPPWNTLNHLIETGIIGGGADA